MATPLWRMVLPAGCLLWAVGTLLGPVPVTAAEPPAMNPFGEVKTERDDAVPGYVEMSDGRILTGNIYMTRDKRVKIYDEKAERQRELPLKAIKSIECTVLEEWVEKEWRFKELALDEKLYTGRSYPSRKYTHTVKLNNGQKIDGELSEIIYIQPYALKPDQPLAERTEAEPIRLLLHKRDKGEPGTDLKSLKYVKLVRLGKEALEEGRAKAAHRPASKSTAKPSAKAKTGKPAQEEPAPDEANGPKPEEQ
jgi:hypothetical protein